MIGVAGAGKSTLGNMFAQTSIADSKPYDKDNEHFVTADSASSVTIVSKIVEVEGNPLNENQVFRIVDTPGLDDGKHNDA